MNFRLSIFIRILHVGFELIIGRTLVEVADIGQVLVRRRDLDREILTRYRHVARNSPLSVLLHQGEIVRLDKMHKKRTSSQTFHNFLYYARRTSEWSHRRYLYS